MPEATETYSEIMNMKYMTLIKLNLTVEINQFLIGGKYKKK